MATLCKVAENDGTVGARIGPIRNGLNAVRSIPKDVFATHQEAKPVAITTDTAEESVMIETALSRHSRRDSIESLLEEEDDDDDDACANATMSEFTDSDDSDSLLGFDDEYLDFLVEILDASSCNSDSGSLSD
ncbi:hypothetical protein PybrP1_007880 [[Pythium] brassicae (nom. inval.)]|nr:hypothetical protein PybrP1_007880 [[Pythium] brassicae (nom. inval.)]